MGQLKSVIAKTACQIARFEVIICAGFRNLKVADLQH
jgi:hypothetical protein